MVEQARPAARILAWANLDTPLRRVVLFGAAVLLGLGAATAIRGVIPKSPVIVSLYFIPPVVTVIAAVALVAALTLLFAGISLSRSAGRYVGILAAAALGAVLVFVSIGVAGAAEIALFLVIALAALIVFAGRLHWLRVLALTAAVAVASVGAIVAVSIASGFHYGAVSVFWVLGSIAFIIAPVLVVVGWDAAELAAYASSWFTRWTQRWRISPHALAAVLAVSGAALALWLTSAHGHATAGELFGRLVLLAAGALGFAWAVARGGAFTAAHVSHVPFVVALVPAIVLILADVGGALFTRDAPGAYNHQRPRQFSLELPAHWQIKPGLWDHLRPPPTMAQTMQVVFAPKGAEFPQVRIMAVPRNGKARIPKGIAFTQGTFDFFKVPLPSREGVKDLSSWRQAVAKVKDRAGKTIEVLYAVRSVTADLPVANADWIRACVAREAEGEAAAMECARIFESFRLDVRVQSDPAAHATLNIFSWMGFGLMALFVVALWRAPFGVFAFFALVALVAVARNVGALDLEGHTGAPAVAVSLSADILAVALLLGAMAVFVSSVEAARNPAGPRLVARDQALAFQSALLVLTVLFVAYVYAAHGSEYSNQIRGIVIILLLLWEFASSGAAFTNGHTERMPRPARILFYLGYLILVATLVFYFVKLDRATGERAQAPLDTEVYVAAGIAYIGMPYLLYRRLTAWLEAYAHRP